MTPGFQRQETEASILGRCCIYFILLVETVTGPPTFKWVEKRILLLDGEEARSCGRKLCKIRDFDMDILGKYSLPQQGSEEILQNPSINIIMVA